MISQYRPVFRTTTAIAGIVALLLTIVIPSVYFAISYKYLIGTLDSEAEQSATNISSLIMVSPEMWIFEQVRLEELLEGRSVRHVSESRRILDSQGKVVAENYQNLQPPLITRAHNINDAGRVVGRIEISRSLFSLVGESFLVALGSLLLGGAMFYTLRQLPLNALKKAVQDVEETERRYSSLYESMKEGMALFRISRAPDGQDSSFSLIDLNPACESIFDIPKEILLYRADNLLVAELRKFFPEIVQAHEIDTPFTFEISIPNRERTLEVSVFFPDGEHFATLFEDITQRKLADKQIRALAYHDPLTGLPNRLLMQDRLEQALARASRDSSSVAVLFLDLDQFKTVNDTLGHANGDILLLQVANRLRGLTRNSDTLARIGGDEFVVILSFSGQELNAAHIAQNLLNEITSTYSIDMREVYTSASIGISMFPDDGHDVQTLLKYADMAMYAAKEAGRGCFNFYSHEMNKKAHERMELENNLRRAIENEQFFLEFQPIVMASDGSVVAAEALVRWQCPGIGRVTPDNFIPVAEETGLMVPLGEWILRTACRKLKEWQESGIPPFRLAVNISGRQFRQKNFVAMVGEILTATGADPRLLELELTESSLFENTDSMVANLLRLKEYGISIAVDDFGSGHSSLGYLKNFPIDRIKIDRLFVTDVCTDPNAKAIVEAIIVMASSLKMAVTVEGVESREQFESLRACNFEEIQGYYFHRPLSEERLLMLMR